MKRRFTMSAKALYTCLAVVFCLVSSSCMLRHPLLGSGQLVNLADSTTTAFTERFGSIVIEVSVNGRATRLAFDTGAGTTLLGAAQAEQLGLEAEFLTRTKDANKQEGDIYMGQLRTLQVNDLEYRDFKVLVVPMDDDRWDCIGIDGIFGAMMIRNTVWKIDFEKKQLTSYRESLPPAQLARFVAIPFTPDELGVPHIEIEVAGRKLTFLVDFGSTFGIDLDAATVATLPASQVHTVVEGGGNSLALFGTQPHQYSMIEVSQARIGSLVIDRPLCRQKDRVSLKIGLGFFRHHEVIIDWSRCLLYLRPFTSTIYSSQFSQVGLSLEAGAVVVSNLAPYDSGISLRLGDRIVAIDDEPVDPTDHAAVCLLLDEMKGDCNRMFQFKYERPGGEQGIQNVRAWVCLPAP